MHELLQRLKDYFEKRKDISLAYLFGSSARNEMHKHSDIDIAVYFKTEAGTIEYEKEDAHYEAEESIRGSLEILTGKNVDLIILNRAPAKIDFSALRGIELKNTDQLVASALLQRSMFDAIDFRYTAHQYYETLMRSRSLNPIDRDRLEKIVTLFEVEIKDLAELKKIGQLEYQQDRNKKRNLERVIENVSNMTIDTARILLGSSKVAIPDTYREMILNLKLIEEFDQSHAESLAQTANMRNLLAHQYADIRFRGIMLFTERTEKSFAYLLEFAKRYLAKNTVDFRP